MPQLTLKLSKNINLNDLNLSTLFTKIHGLMSTVPNLDVKTCHSGVIQEDFSYIGLGEEPYTKVYLEVYWLENKERSEMKKLLATQLMQILENLLVPQIEKQNLICIPRVRIANLGELNQDYHISKHV